MLHQREEHRRTAALIRMMMLQVLEGGRSEIDFTCCKAQKEQFETYIPIHDSMRSGASIRIVERISKFGKRGKIGMHTQS